LKQYQVIADGLAADVASGRLRAGNRLPPQRDFAHRRGIATSTASRVYRELVGRGLVSGEVGRGTYVKFGGTTISSALTEPANAQVDLELNFPILPEQPAILANSLSSLFRRSQDFGETLHPIGARGTPAARRAAAAFLTRDGWSPDQADILFAGNGKQAIAAVLAALVPAGERLGVEAPTYPIVKGLAAWLGIDLGPLAMDDDGLRPDALVRAQRTTPMRAICSRRCIAHSARRCPIGADPRSECFYTS
jgi:DNA-binding transcriptional MocR family regulator